MTEEICGHEACSPRSVRKTHHSDKIKTSLICRQNRIEGQVRGLKGWIEKDRCYRWFNWKNAEKTYCVL